jgi:hypothetical protein
MVATWEDFERVRLVEWLFWCGVRSSDCGPAEGSNGREASYGCSVEERPPQLYRFSIYYLLQLEVRLGFAGHLLGNLDDFRNIMNL